LGSLSSRLNSDTASRHGLHRLAGDSRQVWILSCVLLVAICALYYPVRGYPFIALDDVKYVTANPHIKTLDGSTVVWAFTHVYSANWHPLTWISHALDVEMFGLQPGAHHLVNVILHALNAILLLWVLWKATGYVGRSFMVAALFALHPINVEAVVWIAERKTMLSTLFFLLALGAYRWYASQPKLDRMAVVAFLYSLGLLAKPQVITLPFVLLLWDYWPLRRMFATEPEASRDTLLAEVIPARSFSELLKEKIPLFFICAVDALITIVAQHVGPPGSWAYSPVLRVENALISYAKYLWLALWPANLGIMYLHPGNSLQPWQAGVALLLLLAISALVYSGRRHRYLVVGWLWFLGSLVPMSGIIQVYIQAMADRYAYASFIGLFVMVCWGVADWAAQRHVPRMVLPAVSVAVLVILSFMTHRQISYWKDNVTLWTHDLEVTHRNWAAEYFIGVALRDQGRSDEALPHFYRAVNDMTRRDAEVYLSIAIAEQLRGNASIAIEYYKKALPIVQASALRAQILNTMGIAYRGLGDNASAQQCFYEAAHQPPPPVDWQGDWWRQVIPLIRERLRTWRSGSSG
jgi:protein O-mannosyl-transferase